MKTVVYGIGTGKTNVHEGTNSADANDFGVEIVEGREMTETEIDTVVSILFSWWKSHFENEKPVA